MPSERPSFWIGFGLGALVGGPAAFGYAVLEGHTYAACGVHPGPGYGWFVWFFELPGLWVVNAALFGAVFARVAGATWRRRGIGLAAGLLALLLFAWLVFAVMGTPADEPVPEPICPSNVPPWWPSWIPI